MGIQDRHRPGSLKQQNKAHKHGKHRSKGAVSTADKGKVSVKQLTKKAKGVTSKDDRRNQVNQNRLRKRQEVLTKKRQLGTCKTPPFLVSVVPLAGDVDVNKLFHLVTTCDEDSDVKTSSEGVVHLSIGRWKQRFSFLTPEKGNLFATLDSLKVSDTVLFVASALSTPVVDNEAQLILHATLAQGLPSTAVTLLDMENIPVKKRSSLKQDIQKTISMILPEEKVTSLDKPGDTLNLLRRIGSQKQQRVSQRDNRAHLLAEHMEFSSEEEILKVTGYLRGQSLSVNSLLHIPGWGDFLMKQIDAPSDPYPLERVNSNTEAMSDIVKILEVADAMKQKSLDSENIPDLMDAEQTWPTQEELTQAKLELKQKKIVKKVPKGMSDYQACWIPNEDEEVTDEESDDEDEVMEPGSEEESELGEKSEEEFDVVTTTEGEVDAERYDENLDLDEEARCRVRIKEAKMDEMFPDEVDTPQDIPARDRFQKYRGLSSFRTSPWDTKENLPADYARIFQFEDFNRTKKRIFSNLQRDVTEAALPGLYITIHIAGVSEELVASRRAGEPLVLYGLLDHEQQMSVLNVVVKRYSSSPLSQQPIKSKEELVFQCGYRRYKTRPIFSQHTNGNKHKYERYFQPDSTVVATLYAPIVFPSATVLVWKDSGKCLNLVATGNVLSVNPDRLVIKRVVLSGHLFKVHKRTAVVRFMFFNREDINWFKPVELRTKYGRRGHIKEPLGTHGHMKTVFDGQPKSQDTVLMHLYKRIFPKWAYDPKTKKTSSLYSTLPTIMEEDMD